jgi:hypothetical protein
VEWYVCGREAAENLVKIRAYERNGDLLSMVRPISYIHTYIHFRFQEDAIKSYGMTKHPLIHTFQDGIETQYGITNT